MSDSPTPEERALLDRLFTGDCTPVEQEAVEVVLSRFPEERTRVEAWRSAARRLDGVVDGRVDGDVLYRAFRQRIDGLEMSDAEGGATSSVVRASLHNDSRRLVRELSAKSGVGEVGDWGTRTLRRSLWIGALAVTIGGLILARHVGERRTNLAQMYATNQYQQAILNLNDGTRVTLAPQTALRVLQYGTQGRVVTLERGEAYFEVVHTAGSPFIVRSGAVTAQVLGTGFLMRHETGDTHIRVAVADGKVHVTMAARADTGITLTKGQIGDVTDSTAQVSTTDDVAPGTEWAPGYIMFRHTPLETVLQTVSRWYGYRFQYADKTLGTQRVTMMVSTRSSAEALAVIEHVLVVNLTVVGDTVTLVPQPPKTNHGASRIRTYDVWIPAQEVGR